MNTGARNVIADASASGRKRSPAKKQTVAPNRQAERSHCTSGRRVRQKPLPARCQANGVTTTSWPA